MSFAIIIWNWEIQRKIWAVLVFSAQKSYPIGNLKEQNTANNGESPESLKGSQISSNTISPVPALELHQLNIPGK